MIKICEEIRIPDVNGNILTKQSIKKAIFGHHYKIMKAEIDTYKNTSMINL